MKHHLRKKNRDNSSSKKFTWKQFYYIATFILAVVAIISLYLSIGSTERTSETLESLQDGFNSYTQPILGFSGYDWLRLRDQDTITCSKPPAGIAIKYKNNSNIPILVKDIRLIINYGDQILNPQEFGEEKIDLPETAILIAGEEYGLKVANSGFFNLLKNKRFHDKSPYLELHFHCIISTIQGTNKYQLNLYTRIGIECEDYIDKFIQRRDSVPIKIGQ